MNIKLRKLNCDIPMRFSLPLHTSIYLSWFGKYVIVFRKRTPRNMKFLFACAIGFITCTPGLPPLSLSLLSLSMCMHQTQSNATDATGRISRPSYFPNICVASCLWNADVFYSCSPLRKQYSRVTSRRLNKSYNCD